GQFARMAVEYVENLLHCRLIDSVAGTGNRERSCEFLVDAKDRAGYGCCRADDAPNPTALKRITYA
ncbi:hypothetical protein, partial [Noviherbaspirillum sp. ST9]|uniref:hypothetical protein n=1 Tax=Noviherbaspirillum sp. ST9 TaxID=3401606 RepID=UPI003B58ABF1